MDNDFNHYMPNKQLELLDMIYQAFIIAIIVAIYANRVPFFHKFNFFSDLVYLAFNLSFLWLIHSLFKIQYEDNYQKNVIYILISITIYILLSYILTIDIKDNFIENNNFFISSIFLYLAINIFIILILCYFEYTNNIHTNNIGILKDFPFNMVQNYDYMNILYIIFLYTIPLILFLYFKTIFNVNYIDVTPFLLFSTFLILFTVFIPKLKEIPNNNIESSIDTLENTYYSDKIHNKT
jgi:hypothetical protein